MRGGGAQRGVTLVELLVSVVLAGGFAVLVFTLYAQMAAAYHTQGQVAEVQQTLRVAGDLVARDVRQAGYYVRAIRTRTGDEELRPIQVWNAAGAEGDDAVRLIYADTSTLARVAPTGAPGTPAFDAAATPVDDVTGFAEGDLVAALSIGARRGQGCLLALTGVRPRREDDAPPVLEHAAEEGSPWNSEANEHCAHLRADWQAGDVIVTRLVARSYRIDPDDPAGVLQVSPSGGLVADDWQDLTDGVVDLQLAVRVFQPGDAADADGDGDAERDWLSGDDLDIGLAPPAEVLQVSVSVLARTRDPTGAAGARRTPDLLVAGEAPAHNWVGDQPGRAVPVADPASRYHGAHLYRLGRVQVDPRNLGIGR